jgi:type 1 glutamine amidotransferase
MLAPLTILLAALAAPPTGGEALRPIEVAPGVFVLAFSDRHASANAGWVTGGGEVTLIGAPDAESVPAILDAVRKTTGKAPSSAIITGASPRAFEAARRLLAEGVSRGVVAAGAPGKDALSATAAGPPVEAVRARTLLTRAGRELELVPFDRGPGTSALAVHVRDCGVLFTGEACVHGPRAVLRGTSTAAWIRALRELRRFQPELVVPGAGTTGGRDLIDRQERLLLELRRQVGHRVAQGWPAELVSAGVRIEPEWLVWMPYDTPTREDVDHVRDELTIPRAPFGADPFRDEETGPKTLAIIGDSPHEPGHLEAGLAPVFEAAGLAVRFAVDFRALSKETLAQVRLLILLRDGNSWPEGPDRPTRPWMTIEQERAVVEFVERGGAFLALHNSTGLYPEKGPYLELLGGTYEGHGPLERFRVRVADADHPVTRGVEEYEIADEQHTPRPDTSHVHVILRSISAEGVEAAAGWVREVGKGRVCYLANGHTRDALGHPMFRRLIANAIGWCLDK